MKNLLVVVFVFTLSSLSVAQKGSMYVGGGMHFKKFGGDGDGTSVRLAPEVGTWLANDIQVGGVVSFLSNSKETGSNPKSEMGLLVYGRKWKSMGEKFSVYYGVFGQVMSGKHQSDHEYDGFGLHADAGFAYSIAERWGLAGRAGAIGFSKSNGVSVIGFNLDNVPVFNLGIYYTFKN